MLTKLPKASENEIEAAAVQIANALRQRWFWHENFTRMTKVPQIKTNVGTFIGYGISQPAEVGRQGDVKIMQAKPHSMNLIAVSSVPTSAQKVLLVEAIAMRVARKLGAPADAVVERSDPTLGQKLVVELGRLEGEDRAEEQDPYKTIGEPFSIALRWPAPQSS